MPLWVKGQSGNPNGKPVGGGIKGLLRKHEKEAIDCLIRLMKAADSDKVSLAAAQTVLAYIHGKPPEAAPAASGEMVPMLRSADALDQAERLLEAPAPEGSGLPADAAQHGGDADSDAGVGNGSP